MADNPEIAEALTGDESGNNVTLEAVYDIPVQLSVVLGKTTMQVNQLLKLGRGAAVEFQFPQRKAPAGSDRREVEEWQAHRLPQLPHGVGAHEHQRDMRLHRVSPGQSAQQRDGLGLIGRNRHRRSGKQLADGPAAARGSGVDGPVVQPVRMARRAP